MDRIKACLSRVISKKHFSNYTPTNQIIVPFHGIICGTVVGWYSISRDISKVIKQYFSTVSDAFLKD